MISFDLTQIESKIAYAIYNECGARYYDINEFCSAYGFTKEQFEDFLQHGVDAMTALRVMDKYYSGRE